MGRARATSSTLTCRTALDCATLARLWKPMPPGTGPISVGKSIQHISICDRAYKSIQQTSTYVWTDICE